MDTWSKHYIALPEPLGIHAPVEVAIRFAVHQHVWMSRTAKTSEITLQIQIPDNRGDIFVALEKLASASYATLPGRPLQRMNLEAFATYLN
jgi:hypothetical protein